LKHKTRHTLPKILLLIGSVLGLLILSSWLVTDGRIPVIELSLRWIFLASALFLGSVGGFITYFEYHGIGSQDGIMRRGERQPYVSITFDDGPSPKHTSKILDILKEKNVKATFFVVGKNVEKYPEIARRIVEEGHDIANHTYSHKELLRSTRKTIIKELTKTDEAIKRITHTSADLFRPPRGMYSSVTRKLVVEMGYKIILWSVSSVDWRQTSPIWILNRIKRYARMGSIILFHDGGALLKGEGGQRINTVKALPLVIDYLQSQDLQIVTVSKLMRISSADSIGKDYDFSEEEPQEVLQ